MNRLLLVGALVISAVAASLGFNMKNETSMSELMEDNIEALSKEGLNRYPCIKNKDFYCTEWFVISDGATGVVNYPDYMNYMEVEVDE